MIRFFCFLILSLSCCYAQEIKAQNLRTYTSLTDNRSFTFDEEKNIKINRGDSVAPHFFEIEGEYVEVQLYNVFRKFKIDRVDSENSKFISIWHKGHRVYGYHLFFDDNLLIVTPLKTLKGLEERFTSPSIYSLENSQVDLDKSSPKLELTFIDPVLDEIYYLNYCDPSDCPYGDSYSAIVEETTSAINVPPDTRMFAYKNIQVNLAFDDKEHEDIPVLYDLRDYDFVGKKEDEVRVYFEQLGISNFFAVAERFNPSRKRVVNKVFEREVEGQVSTFKIYTVDSFLNYCCK